MSLFLLQKETRGLVGNLRPFISFQWRFGGEAILLHKIPKDCPLNKDGSRNSSERMKKKKGFL
jgi:hypothetical protein